MSSIQTEQLADRTVIRVRGDFTFDIHRAFREAYQAQSAGSRYEIDLSQAQYMDSAGLGMLIQLREYAGGKSDSVILSGTNPTLRGILEIANFPRLFQIS